MENDVPNLFNEPNPNFASDPLLGQGELSPSAEEKAELERKALAYKRITYLLLVIALVLLGFIIWELVDISLGGRPS